MKCDLYFFPLVLGKFKFQALFLERRSLLFTSLSIETAQSTESDRSAVRVQQTLF